LGGDCLPVLRRQCSSPALLAKSAPVRLAGTAATRGEPAAPATCWRG
jgi:hypothetical protein